MVNWSGNLCKKQSSVAITVMQQEPIVISLGIQMQPTHQCSVFHEKLEESF